MMKTASWQSTRVHLLIRSIALGTQDGKSLQFGAPCFFGYSFMTTSAVEGTISRWPLHKTKIRSQTIAQTWYTCAH
ncbi:hypothetical protein X975_03355, partial [Stegodyphus mimosarum]